MKIKTYIKKPVEELAYAEYSHRIRNRLGKAYKDVRIYPIYDKAKDIVGIRVTVMFNKDNKWIDQVIKQTLHIIESAA